MPSIMRCGGSGRGDSLRDRRRFNRTALLTAMGLYACLLAIPASAEIVPGIPTTLPAVGPANGFSAVRYTASGSVQASSHPPAPPESAADGFEGSNTEFGDAFDIDGIMSAPDELGTAVSTSDSAAVALASASAKLGTLGASATVDTRNTATSATSRAVAEWIDLIARDANIGGIINVGGKFDVKVIVSGSLGGIVGAGTASVWAQLWIFPFTSGDALPQPFAGINAQYYRSFYLDISGLTLDETVGDLNDLPVGMQFMAYARLETRASLPRFSGSQPNFPDFTQNHYSNYSNTFEMFIDPSPETPWARLSGATGFDYRTPVPEPASVALAVGALLTGIGGNCLRRRRD